MFLQRPSNPNHNHVYFYSHECWALWAQGPTLMYNHECFYNDPVTLITTMKFTTTIIVIIIVVVITTIVVVALGPRAQFSVIFFGTNSRRIRVPKHMDEFEIPCKYESSKWVICENAYEKPMKKSKM